MDSSENLVAELEVAYRSLCEQHDFATEPIILKRGSLNFIGVRSGLESTLDFAELRANLHPILTDQRNFVIVQVVGDSSAPFTDQGIDCALKLLSEHTSQNTVIEYGYTAQQGDANWIVNEHLERNPGSGPSIIANVVGQSIEVLKRNKRKPTSRVQNFMVLYHEGGALTRFGEDTWLSDGLMSADSGDKMICLEGGPQSFRQAANVLCNGISVVACTGLRPLADGFSAAALLLELGHGSSTGHRSMSVFIM